MTDERRNELIDEVLKFQQELRAITKPWINEERVFFLEALRTGIKGAEDVFRTGDPTSTGKY